jgi:hypothetical protein
VERIVANIGIWWTKGIIIEFLLKYSISKEGEAWEGTTWRAVGIMFLLFRLYLYILLWRMFVCLVDCVFFKHLQMLQLFWPKTSRWRRTSFCWLRILGNVHMIKANLIYSPTTSSESYGIITSMRSQWQWDCDNGIVVQIWGKPEQPSNIIKLRAKAQIISVIIMSGGGGVKRIFSC